MAFLLVGLVRENVSLQKIIESDVRGGRHRGWLEPNEPIWNEIP